MTVSLRGRQADGPGPRPAAPLGLAWHSLEPVIALLSGPMYVSEAKEGKQKHGG